MTNQTLELYTGVEFNDRYTDVLDTLPRLLQYLDGKRVAQINNAEFYLQDEGDISIELPGFAEYPNYMYYGNIVDNRKFYFIESVRIFNDVVTLHYKLDTWHTYGVTDGIEEHWRIRNGHRTLATRQWGKDYKWSYVSPITKPIILGTSIEDWTIHEGWNSDDYTIMYTGYFYTGVKDNGDVSEARPFYGYLSFITALSGVQESQYDDLATSQISGGANAGGRLYHVSTYDEAVDLATKIYQGVTGKQYMVGGVKNCYAEISHLYIIPYGIAYNYYNTEIPWMYTYSDEGTLSDKPLYVYLTHSDTTLSGTELHIAAFYEQLPDDNPQVQENGVGYRPIDGSFNYRSVGTLQHMIDIPYALYDELPKCQTRLYLSTGSISILFWAFGQTVDITSDFEYELNFNPESALTAVQRKNLAKQDTLAFATRLIGMGGNVGASIASGDVAGALSGIVGGVETIANYALKRNQQSSSITSSPADTDVATQYHGLCKLRNEIRNYDEINDEYKRFGFNVSWWEDEMSFSGDDGYFPATPMDVVQYESVDVIANGIPEQYKEEIRQILLNGVRIWHQIELFDYNDMPNVTDIG